MSYSPVMQPTSLADSSALVAYLEMEPGAEVVRNALSNGMAMNVVNWSETLTVLGRHGVTAADLIEQLHASEVLGQDGLLTIIPVTEADARQAAELYLVASPQGLSLGDRFCLATGLRLNLPVLTAERSWATFNLGLPIRQIRP